MRRVWPVWFGPKSSGIGVSPASWQGWLATLLFLLVLFGVKFFFRPQDFGFPDWSRAAAIGSLVVGFVLLTFLTYGENGES